MKSSVFYEEFDSFYFYGGTTENWEMQEYHFHKEYEIILFLSDGAVIEIGNSTYTAEIGDVFLINSQEYHRTAGGKSGEYQRYVLMFEPDFVRRAGDALQYSFLKYFEEHQGDFIHRLHLDGEKLEHLERMFRQVENIYHDKSEVGRAAVRLKILEILTFLNKQYDFFVQTEADQESAFRDGGASEEKDRKYENVKSVTAENESAKAPQAERQPGDRERIEQIKRYIGEHIDEKLELEGLADHFFISRHYLSHYFKKETGFTLGQYITNRKIAEAKRMLRQGFTVTETAVALSYSSESHFINTFKRLTGTTPKKYSSEKQD